MTPYERLYYLVFRIEQSELEETEKQKLYSVIKDSLSAATLPIIAKYMSDTQLSALASNLSQVTPQRYLDLLRSAFQTPEANQELDQLIEKLLLKFEEILKKEGII